MNVVVNELHVIFEGLLMHCYIAIFLTVVPFYELL